LPACHRRCCLQTASSLHYTTSCKHSLVLLGMGEIIARNVLNWLKLLIQLLLHLVGCLYYYYYSRIFFVSGTENSRWFQLACLWCGDRAPGIKRWRSNQPDPVWSDLPWWTLLRPWWCWQRPLNFGCLPSLSLSLSIIWATIKELQRLIL